MGGEDAGVDAGGEDAAGPDGDGCAVAQPARENMAAAPAALNPRAVILWMNSRLDSPEL